MVLEPKRSTDSFDRCPTADVTQPSRLRHSSASNTRRHRAAHHPGYGPRGCFDTCDGRPGDDADLAIGPLGEIMTRPAPEPLAASSAATAADPHKGAVAPRGQASSSIVLLISA